MAVVRSHCPVAFGAGGAVAWPIFALLLLALAPGCSVFPRPLTSLGRLPPRPTVGIVAGQLLMPETSGAATEPVVVYLEPLEVEGEAVPAGRTATVRQLDGALHPDFLAVAQGDGVRFLNEDQVFQQVFSTSRPNEFDTGLLRRGAAKVVWMRHPGVVRVYSALDETTTGLIYVTPSPHFAVVRPPGRFELENVPAGRYALRTWREEGLPVRRELRVEPGARSTLEIPLEGAEASP